MGASIASRSPLRTRSGSERHLCYPIFWAAYVALISLLLILFFVKYPHFDTALGDTPYPFLYFVLILSVILVSMQPFYTHRGWSVQGGQKHMVGVLGVNSADRRHRGG